MYTIQADQAKRFFETALERQIIYLKKEAGLEKPWTQDKTFQGEFFCNVFRTQDAFTKWLNKYVLKPYANDPDLWRRIIVCRYYSRVDALEDVRLNEGLDSIGAIKSGIFRRKKAGQTIHTQAFLVGFDNEVYRRWCRPFYWIEELSEIGAPFKRCRTLEEAWNILTALKWCGPFIAYEIVTDFSYCPSILNSPTDTYIWSSPGPGAKRGMNRLLTGKAEQKVPLTEYLDFSLRLLALWKEWLSLYSERRDSFAEEAIRNLSENLTMREVEHWLCEYDKYVRGGTSKRRYNGYGE
jgi:hypothetical protein